MEKVCGIFGTDDSRLPWKNEENEACKVFKNNLRNAIINAIKKNYNIFCIELQSEIGKIASEILFDLKKEYDFIVEVVMSNDWNKIAEISKKSKFASMCERTTYFEYHPLYGEWENLAIKILSRAHGLIVGWKRNIHDNLIVFMNYAKETNREIFRVII